MIFEGLLAVKGTLSWGKDKRWLHSLSFFIFPEKVVKSSWQSQHPSLQFYAKIWGFALSDGLWFVFAVRSEA